MKNLYLKNLIAVCFCAISMIIFGCAKQEQSVALIDIAPKDAKFILLYKADSNIQSQLTKRNDYKRLINAIKNNPKIIGELKKSLAEASRKTMGMTDILFSKEDPITSIEDILIDELTEILVFSTQAFSKNTKTFDGTIIVKTKTETFAQKIKESLSKSPKIKPSLFSGNEGFIWNDKKTNKQTNVCFYKTT